MTSSDDPTGAETWTTRTVTVETPRGLRYRGICYVGTGRPTYGPLPRGAAIRYETRLHRSLIEASEQARGRTIHHNLWHDGSPDATRIGGLHLARYCHER